MRAWTKTWRCLPRTLHRLTAAAVLLAAPLPAAGRDQPDALPQDPAREPQHNPNLESKLLHATIDLRDGSRLIGRPAIQQLKFQSALGGIEVRLEQVRELSRGKEDGRTKLEFHNGDRIRGELTEEHFPVDSCLGRLQVPWAEVDKVVFVMRGGRGMPPGEGPLEFGGIRWTPQRVAAEVRGKQLVTLPQARKGFHYGHSGNGRGATLVSNVGNPQWKDYRMECDLVVTGVDPGFNPHRIQSNQVGISVYFHLADIKESWNEKGHSSYAFAIHPGGEWVLRSIYNQHCPGARGYRSSTHDGMRTLAQGNAKAWKVNQPKRVAIEVIGMRIRVWLDGQALVDLVDEEMGREVGGMTLDHGGIGFRWGWEGMGRVENFSVEQR